jgi:drug/metabolite transporter (DMT)-like permease
LLVLGELPTAVQLLGGAFIVAGVALVRIDELRPPRTRPAPNARRLEPSLVRQKG